MASIKTNWDTLKQQDADEAKVPVVLFVLCKSVTDGSTAAGLVLNGTIVQRILWEGEPPPTAENDTPYFQVSLKGPLVGGRLEERRREARIIDGTTTMVHATINLTEAPIDIQPHWSLFPFQIFKGKVELELQAKLVDKGNDKDVMLCPDLCICKDIGKHLNNLVKVKGGMTTIEICEDRRDGFGVQANDDDPTHQFVTYPQMTLTFWLHEPVSKAMFKIFGSLLLVLVLMLVNFRETCGSHMRDWFDDGTRNNDHADYFANVIAIGIAAVVVIPSIRSTSVISSVHSFTVDDAVAVVFVFGLALSAWPHCLVAFVGCLLSCVVVVGALVSLVAYLRECRRIVNEEFTKPFRVTRAKEDAKDGTVKKSARDFTMGDWERVQAKTDTTSAAAPHR